MSSSADTMESDTAYNSTWQEPYMYVFNQVTAGRSFIDPS